MSLPEIHLTMQPETLDEGICEEVSRTPRPFPGPCTLSRRQQPVSHAHLGAFRGLGSSGSATPEPTTLIQRTTDQGRPDHITHPTLLLSLLSLLRTLTAIPTRLRVERGRVTHGFKLLRDNPGPTRSTMRNISDFPTNQMG